MSHQIAILGGHVVDPVSGIDGIANVYINDGKIVDVTTAIPSCKADTQIDATGQYVFPGLVDLGVRLREPGLTAKATIASESHAAIANGITTLICMPDTQPVIDNPLVVNQIRQSAQDAGGARVLPIGAFTQNLDGELPSNMAALKQENCVAVCNGQAPLRSSLTMMRVMQYANDTNMPVMLYPNDPDLHSDGCAHSGLMATSLGLPSIPVAAETIGLMRDIALAEETQSQVHFCRLSAARSSEILRSAQQRAANDKAPTADVAIHQLFLTDADLEHFNANCHVKPPLRTSDDRDALRQAVASGEISVICSDHQPHDPEAKEQPFPETEPGISGLDTLLSLGLQLVADGVLTLSQLIERLTIGPMAAIGQQHAGLSAGAAADVIIVDAQAARHLSETNIHSRGKNTPFINSTLAGEVLHTIVDGQLLYSK